MVERIVIDRTPLQMAMPADSISNARALSVIKADFVAIETAYNIHLSDIEHFYIYELLFR